MRSRQALTIVSLTAVLLALVMVPQAAAVRLDETAIFIEINDTDGDAGIQIFLDGEGWDVMQVFDPNGTEILGVLGESSIAQQGITELFFGLKWGRAGRRTSR